MHHLHLHDVTTANTRDRYQHFQHVVSDIFGQQWQVSGPELNAQALEVDGSTCDGFTIVRGHTQPMEADHPHPQPNLPHKYFIFTSDRPFQVSSGVKQLGFGSGEIVLLSNSRPCNIICHDTHISSAFIIDAHLVEGHLGNPASLIGEHLDYTIQSQVPLRKTLDLGWAFHKSNQFAQAAPYILSAFLNQLALAELLVVVQKQELQQNTVSATTTSAVCTMLRCKNRVKHIIDQRFNWPDFSLGNVAAEIGVSARYIQQCFARDGETASGYLRNKRLQVAEQEILEQRGSKQSLTEIAYACGFNSASHFSTEFRKYCGMSPTQFRNKNRADYSR